MLHNTTTPDQLYQQAIGHHQAGQLDNAKELYLNILDQDPKYVAAHQNLVDIFCPGW